MLDEERCYRAVQSKDPRFDGWFYTAVVTTRIYCRPSCPAMPPKRRNVRFYPSAAAAHGAGFRACKRCRPDAAPGSPEWNTRADVVGRAIRMIGDGIVDREGVSGLARHLGYSSRQLNRLLMAELGAGPLALARAQRAQSARVLLETTALSVADIAFAVGFGSVRQFNDTIQQVFALTPTALRAAQLRHRQAGSAPPTAEVAAPGTITLRLAHRAPFASEHLLQFLALRGVPGVEAGDAHSYRRTLTLPHGSATVILEAASDHIRCKLRLDDLRDLGAAVARSRRLLDLDADPVAIDGQLGADPRLGPLVSARPGLRMPGAVDGDEVVIRAVLGQQVSVAGSRSIAGKLTERYGEKVVDPVDGLTLRFPTALALAGADPGQLPMPAARAKTLVGLAGALAAGELVVDPGVDRGEVVARLQAFRGVGPWTIGYVRIRGLSDPDTFLAGDLGARRALDRLGQVATPSEAAELAERWRPWRSYALLHLWGSLPVSPTSSELQ